MSDLKEWMNPLLTIDVQLQVADGEINRLRTELAGAIKSRNAAITLYESVRQSREDLLKQRIDWQEALRTLDSERAINALMTEEIKRLEACLRYEQHLAERIGTHGPGCETWGPAHYECVVRALKELESRAAQYRVVITEIIDDLETRATWKEGEQKGVVTIGQGAYLRAKSALAEGEGK